MTDILKLVFQIFQKTPNGRVIFINLKIMKLVTLPFFSETPHSIDQSQPPTSELLWESPSKASLRRTAPDKLNLWKFSTNWTRIILLLLFRIYIKKKTDTQTIHCILVFCVLNIAKDMLIQKNCLSEIQT